MNPLLYLTRAEQARTLEEVGLRDITMLRDEGGMALYRGVSA